ncbi:hypothetical protein CC85DRAFT_269617 [Cutaneotrichosporon oleaginosum]|uniref:Fe2OG dioxygenase domain-containing protein n=1 Tax=Cutaneotrichosporon oleaginosum TaxID=879819 RepID=A0A0J0XVW6_9TREE|nr:uncharacterized protein CC85DRAFT_269617 [Cutaneotrichosporon oleaginosum]KLT45222.1 hypothetical protein CC85DRAFT_269617 [Cutaneotrichosporon oleaginosum]TXT14943.1 hypothetical protein COLE_01136 [Cutaneotrichosporon oleaginosum]
MAKNQAKKRKRTNGAAVPNAKVAKPAPVLAAPPTPESETDALLLPEEVDSAVFVLRTLAENPAALAGKEMKDLKRAVYELHRVMVDGATIGTSLTSRISAALKDYRFTDALILLYEMYTRRLPPKLGALQRWVRECDATSGADGSPGDPEALRCLDMILRIANHTPGVVPAGESAVAGDHVRKSKIWLARPYLGAEGGEIAIWARMRAGTLVPPEALEKKTHPGFRPVHFIRGADRRPPNLYDSTVYTSEPGTIRLTPPAARRAPSRLDVPGVPGAFIILDVFTPDECLQIVQAASAIGFEKDQAAEGSALLKTSILARNFVWLADKHFLDHFYAQILPFVHPTAPAGPGALGKVRGINARFRVYQYTENQLYRPHIDGAWPAAGLDPTTGEYLHDSQPPDDPLWSRYTLLVYLNSDVPEDTGCTTFFMPSNEMGVMDATSVRPIQGAVLCFPHGDTEGSLLHEGSAVGKDGGKIVIRTELLYEAKGFGAFKPPVPVLE